MKRMLVVAAPLVVLLAFVGSRPAGAQTKAPSTLKASTSGTESFRIASTSPNTNKESIIATGLFTAGGVDLARKHNKSLLKLNGGTLVLHHPGGHETDKFHKKTCLVDGSGHGKYTFGGGTGDYAGVSGHGTYREAFQAVLPRTTSGACNTKANPVAFQLTINAHGPANTAS